MSQTFATPNLPIVLCLQTANNETYQFSRFSNVKMLGNILSVPRTLKEADEKKRGKLDL